MAAHHEPPAQPTAISDSIAGATGAVMRPQYMGRDMKFFPVTEGELDSFGSMNLEANVFLAVGTGLISIAIGIAANHLFADKPSAAADVLCYFGCPILVLVGIVALWLCRKLTQKRDAIWDKIVKSTPSSDVNRPNVFD